VRREAAIWRFLEAAGIYNYAEITGYDDVFGYFVDEDGTFIGDFGEMTPEEAAEWFLRDLWGDWRDKEV